LLHYGGLTAAYGDILRRAISGKGRSLARITIRKKPFLFLAKQRGRKLSEEVYRQIETLQDILL
jgi:hypothetical protein